MQARSPNAPTCLSNCLQWSQLLWVVNKRLGLPVAVHRHASHKPTQSCLTACCTTVSMIQAIASKIRFSKESIQCMCNFKYLKTGCAGAVGPEHQSNRCSMPALQCAHRRHAIAFCRNSWVRLHVLGVSQSNLRVYTL